MQRKLLVSGLILMLSEGSILATPDNIAIFPDEVISSNYIGNGVQWDPYQLDYGHGRLSISPDDKAKLYRRLDYMKPGFIRVMINTTSQIENGKLKPEKNIDDISLILDYCQSRNITVMFGDWGGNLVNSDTKKVNSKMITAAVNYIDFLVSQRGYDCIKYYNFINEPNGWWATTKGDFKLWADGMQTFNKALNRTSISGKVKLVGPDAAIWTTDDCIWVENASSTLGNAIGLYDIHTYPSKYTVNSGEYFNIIKAYRDATPSDKQIVMGEIGLKYVAPQDSILAKENISRAERQQYASVEDSQMSVYDFSYGIDMADALIQTVAAGYSGSVAWMLDDAMHCREERDKLKIWGFWNIFGEEFFGAAEEQVRPWYYAWSLLCRYMPKGSNVIKSVCTSGDCKVCTVTNNGNYSIFIVNSHENNSEAHISASKRLNIADASIYIYNENLNPALIADEQIKPLSSGLNLSLQDGCSFTIPARSVMVITNINI